jgi:tetratricopeptide (TPR) repeat protein
MDENLTSLTNMRDCILLNGRDVARDPGMAQLRRYLPVLAVIAAPYAGLGGEHDPLNPLDPAGEWRTLLDMLAAVNRLQTEVSARLALVRLAPPTSEQLGAALAAGGPDSFRVAHLVCHGERDMLYLEDENGYEALAVAEHIVNLFKPGGARLVVMDGCFSQRMARMLIDDTPVEAVVGTRRRVSARTALTFASHFYAQLTARSSVRTAFRAAIGELERQPESQADRYELVMNDDLREVTLPLPEPRERASHSLVVDGMPRIVGVPSPVGFVGRRDDLRRLAGDMPDSGVGLCAVHGPSGIGKSWLAAEFVTRFAWRFPDGALRVSCSAMTTSQEIIAQAARLLELPLYALPDDVLAALRERRALLALDGVDTLASSAELERLGGWIRSIGPGAGSWVLLTARRLSEMLSRAGEGRAYRLEPFDHRAARTLAMRLAVEREVDALDVDTIDDFLDLTRGWPWLIVRGVELVGTLGIERALDMLSILEPESPDPVEVYLRRRMRALATSAGNPLGLISRAQGLPDAFDTRLAHGLAGEGAQEQIETLRQNSLLMRAGNQIAIPLAARAFAGEYAPLNQQSQDLIDKTVMTYLARSWPERADDAPPVIDPEMRARLNNTRALLQRQLRSDIAVDLVVMGRLLVVAAPAFCEAGLAEEFLAYAQGFREKMADGPDLARLQVAMGEALSALPDHQTDAGWMFQVTLRLERPDRAARAEACLAYGRYLAQVGQTEAAGELYSIALRDLLAQSDRADVTLAAALAHEWANALVAQERYEEAVRRYEAALAGYAETQAATLSALAQRDLSRALLFLGDADRAEDTLRRALATADYVGRRDLAGQIRSQLASAHVVRADEARQHQEKRDERAELAAAAGYLSDALVDGLADSDSAALAEVYLDLGRAQGRLNDLDDAAANATRSLRLLERAGRLPDLAAALVIVGQLQMARGDSVIAQTALHEALELAAALPDQGVMAQAAGVLVRVHQIRARHGPQADRQFIQNALEQVNFTRAQFANLGLGEHVAALDGVVHSLMRQ